MKRLLLLSLLIVTPALVAGGGPVNSGGGGATLLTTVYDPASLAAGSSRCDDVTVTGILTTKAVVANIGAVDPGAGCVIASMRVNGANTVRICWRNAIDAVTACDTASSTWTFVQP